MKTVICVLILSVFLCNRDNAIKSIVPKEVFNCPNGQMDQAWYTHGMDETVPAIKGLYSEFVIVVDTSLKATNFISFHVDYCRNRAISLDTSELRWRELNWDSLSIKQKRRLLKRARTDAKVLADSLYRADNPGLQQVWIINNSKDTVSIQMQDWSYVCVLQARAKDGEWYPVQYWRFSDCGNSYYSKAFPPKSANSFVTKIPNEGDFPTKLRYKLLGETAFYYSNEFEGKINYCRFALDSIQSERSPYELEEFIKLQY